MALLSSSGTAVSTPASSAYSSGKLMQPYVFPLGGSRTNTPRLRGQSGAKKEAPRSATSEIVFSLKTERSMTQDGVLWELLSWRDMTALVLNGYAFNQCY